ncbi:hypothetical protein BK708_36905 [Bacillus thuringiensis serovar yunnanensis]|nr:hypothetical protein BK708_36905 [Bacillus thuringiensis serovar yunnanensis]
MGCEEGKNLPLAPSERPKYKLEGGQAPPVKETNLSFLTKWILIVCQECFRYMSLAKFIF